MPRNPFVMIVKTGGDPAALVAPVGDAVGPPGRRAPDLRCAAARVYVERAQAIRRFTALLAAVFAAAALLLAVGRRLRCDRLLGLRPAREFGVRLALGARASQIVRAVVRESTLLTATGLLVGIARRWSAPGGCAASSSGSPLGSADLLRGDPRAGARCGPRLSAAAPPRDRHRVRWRRFERIDAYDRPAAWVTMPAGRSGGDGTAGLAAVPPLASISPLARACLACRFARFALRWAGHGRALEQDAVGHEPARSMRVEVDQHVVDIAFGHGPSHTARGTRDRPCPGRLRCSWKVFPRLRQPDVFGARSLRSLALFERQRSALRAGHRNGRPRTRTGEKSIRFPSTGLDEPKPLVADETLDSAPEWWPFQLHARSGSHRGLPGVCRRRRHRLTTRRSPLDQRAEQSLDEGWRRPGVNRVIRQVKKAGVDSIPPG